MVPKELFTFLKELKKNNHKDWFDINRPLYAQLKNEFELFINHAIAEISLFDKDAAQTTAKASIFRINRDIRFSTEKTPYKTNMGAFIAQGGRKSMYAGYYIHLEPGASFLSGGIYMPAGPVIKAIRNEIADNMVEFKSIVQHPSFIAQFGKSLWGEQLKVAPKGFPKDLEGIEYLKYKHYSVFKNEPDALYTQKSIFREIQTVFNTLAPFNAFLNRAIDNVEE
jgi:uncharacterized protein (TIGR02453 family)